MSLPPLALSDLTAAVSTVPAGGWAVGVSGGADSVALLTLLRDRAMADRDLQLYVVHLNHQTRGPDSAADASLVGRLAKQWELPCTIAARDSVEATRVEVLANPSARYRAARFALFHQVVSTNGLQGVILAHHLDDQVETVFQRLLRGGGYTGLHGMSSDTLVCGVRVFRPLLSVRGTALRAMLTSRSIAWREDASNSSERYQRNRVRKLLAAHPVLRSDLLNVGDACMSLRAWAHVNAPELEESFPVVALQGVCDLLATHAARRWLVSRGATRDDINPATVQRLLAMARDAATPSRQHFPGPLLLRRRRGVIWAERTG